MFSLHLTLPLGMMIWLDVFASWYVLPYLEQTVPTQITVPTLGPSHSCSKHIHFGATFTGYIEQVVRLYLVAIE